jgi:biopolymer transport protein ExbD
LEKLKVQAANGMDQVVILQASDTTEYKHIMKALELCSQAKVTNVAFNTGKAGDGDRKGSR